MQNFKIVLGSQYFEGLEPPSGGQQIQRIITAESQEIAIQVGNAMLGEEVATSEYFTKLHSVEPTDEAPLIGGWDPDHTWDRVQKKLGKDVVLDKDDKGAVVVMEKSSIIYH